MTQNVSGPEGEWREYRLLVISELRRIDEKVDRASHELKKTMQDSEVRLSGQIASLSHKISDLSSESRVVRDDVMALKAKAAVWGFIAGAVPAIIGAIIALT